MNSSRPTKLYRPEPNLEDLWSRHAQDLSHEQLQTVLFKDLRKALDAAVQGQFRLVGAWLKLTEGRLFSAWEYYETSVILPEEITAESVLGHRYLSLGLEGWLEALAEFRDNLNTGVNRQSVLARAEAAQRMLVVVQLEQEQRLSPQSVLAWAS